jgi:hypothetical protein
MSIDGILSLPVVQRLEDEKDRMIVFSSGTVVAFRKDQSGDWHLIDSEHKDQRILSPSQYIQGEIRNGYKVSLIHA